MIYKLIEDYLSEGIDNDVKIVKGLRVRIDNKHDCTFIWRSITYEWALLKEDNEFIYVAPSSITTIGEWRAYFKSTSIKLLIDTEPTRRLVGGDIFKYSDHAGYGHLFVIIKALNHTYLIYSQTDFTNPQYCINPKHTDGLSYKEIAQMFHDGAKLYYCGNISELIKANV